MKCKKLPKTDLNLSEFCLGAMPFGHKMDEDEVEELVEIFMDEGGNFIDTAHCYAFWSNEGYGCSEKALGACIKRNNIRDKLIIATKGAHPEEPRYRPTHKYMSAQCIEADLNQSLEWMQTDVIDLYWLHRDDTNVPVGEIVDFMNDFVSSKRIRYFGGSNWSVERLIAANEYAEKHNKAGFVASQPEWNLAHRPTPLGTLLKVTGDDIDYYREYALPLIPYGPNAQGYFDSNGTVSDGLKNPISSARLERVQQLAKEITVTPGQLALAWLLNQDLHVIPIIGTSQPERLLSYLGANKIRLTPEQVRWLEHGD